MSWRKTRNTGDGQPQQVPVTEDSPLPVQLIDQEDETPVRVRSESSDLPTTSLSFNITLTSADTQYPQVLPAGCQHFEWQARTEVAVRYILDQSGRVATPTGVYHTLKAGDYYYSPRLDPKAPSHTLYLASATAGTVVELLAWS